MTDLFKCTVCGYTSNMPGMHCNQQMVKQAPVAETPVVEAAAPAAAETAQAAEAPAATQESAPAAEENKPPAAEPQQ